MQPSTSQEQNTTLSANALKEYDQVIIRVFEKFHKSKESERLPFTKADIVRAVDELGFEINNVPDIAYTYRTGRSPLPQAILAHGNWAIDGTGKGKYTFVRLARSPYVDIPADVETIRILDATPQIILKYQSTDEQAILARIRYNRLMDIFSGLTTCHLQGHLEQQSLASGKLKLTIFTSALMPIQWRRLPVASRPHGMLAWTNLSDGVKNCWLLSKSRFNPSGPLGRFNTRLTI